MAYHFEPRMYLEEKAVPLPKNTTATGVEGLETAEGNEEKTIYMAYILLLVIMLVYVTMGTWMERRKCSFGHETGVVILLGISIGAALKFLGQKTSTEFNPVVLFDFGLPFILYAAGYNMRRRRFFEDINNITMFGVLSTVVCFVLLSLSTITIFNMGWVYKFSETDTNGKWTHEQVFMPAIEISLLCGMLCSSDIIAAVSLVKYKEYPKIFSILLGEGLWNDAVAVVLAQSAEKLVSKHQTYTMSTIVAMVGNFFFLSFVSALIGFIGGVISSLMTKHFRFLTRNSIHETFVLATIAFLSYYIADMFEMSGIISIIVTAMMQAQYSWYNLSPQGKSVTAVTFQALGYFSEALIFSYIGLGIFQMPQQNWSITFISMELVIIVFSRLFSVLSVQYFFVMCGADHKLKFTDCVFISYAGMIRGAIALGLAIKAEGSFQEYEFVVASVLALVILSTLIFGSFMPIVAKCLLDRPKHQVK